MRIPFQPVQREAAEHYLLVTLLSFAASVTLTRLFLDLSGYPRIGGGELHIAHVLWGGLLLFAAALLPLLFANHSVYTAGAVLAGVGVGLFIDEVGKFVTERNDYFYPAAAPIIYAFFLLTILLLLRIRRLASTNAFPDLSRALEGAWESLHHPLQSQEYARLRARLKEAADSTRSQRHADLARALLNYMDEEAALLPPVAPAARRQLRRWPEGRRLGQLLSDNRLRLLLVAGLLAIGLLTLKNPLEALLRPGLPPEINAFLDTLHSGRRIEAAEAPLWSGARLGLESMVGILLLTAGGLLAGRRTTIGAAAGYLGLLLSLTTVNLLLFYFEQFSTIITTGIQFLLLFGIAEYRRRLRPA